EESVGGELDAHAEHLTEFRLEAGLPVWRYAFGDATVERRLLLLHRQNTVHVSWRLVHGAAPLRIMLRPALHFRLHEAPVSTALEGVYTVTAADDRYEIHGPAVLPTLRLLLNGQQPSFTVESRRIEQVIYRVERSRGYADTGTLVSPGYFSATLTADAEATLIASTEPWEVVAALTPSAAREAERERRRRLIVAASLWFFHALDRYVGVTGDRVTLGLLLPILRDVVSHHLRGTRFGIGVDPADGLLRQGSADHPLTWMDAKVDDWIVTPRRGKPVELNALWYNAVRLLEGWTREAEGDAAAKPYGELAARAADAFNARFWYAAGGYCY